MATSSPNPCTAAPHRCFLVDLVHVPEEVTSVRLMGRVVRVESMRLESNNDAHDDNDEHDETMTTEANSKNDILLVLDDGSGSTASIVAPRYMWDNLPVKDIGQLMECVATAEYYQLSTSSLPSHDHNEQHPVLLRAWVAQALMVVVHDSPHVEALRMLELTLSQKPSSSNSSSPTTKVSADYGYPTLAPSVATGEDILHLIQTGIVGYDQDHGTSTGIGNGVSLQELSLVLNLPESQVYHMVQELQDQGLVYDKNNQQSYAPL